MRRRTFSCFFNCLFLFPLLSICTAVNGIQPAYEIEAGYSEIAFLARIEKLAEKLLRSEKRGSDAIYKAFHEIKNEIESYYNSRLDMDSFLEEVRDYLKKNRIYVPSKYLNAIFKKLKKGSYNNDHSYRLKKHDKEAQQEEINIPTALIYGITAIAAGAFLCFTRIPICVKVGEQLIIAGLTSSASAMAEINDENRNKEKDND